MIASARGHLPAFLIFLATSLIVTWPLALHLTTTPLDPGDPYFQSWTMAWNWHALTTDPTDIFDANIFWPHHNTLAYADHLFGQTLLTLPALALTESGLLALNLSVLLALTLSAVAMYLLVLDLTSSRVAAVGAGLAYAFAPPFIAHLGHMNLISAQWPPLALLCLRRVVNASTLGWRPTRLALRWAGALGVCVFVAGLFGIYFLYFTLVALLLAGGVYAVAAIVARDYGRLSTLLLAAGSCAIGVLLLLPSLLPYLRVREELGIERSVEEVTFYSANPEDYLAVAPSVRLYAPLLSRFHLNLEHDLFPGAVVLVLAALGLWNRRAGLERCVLAVVAAGSICLSFGLSAQVFDWTVPLPYQVPYDLLPGFRAIRVPARLGLLALTGLAGLAGLGIDLLWRTARQPEAGPRRWHAPSVGWLSARYSILLIAVFLGLGIERLTAIDMPERAPDDRRDVHAWIRANPGPVIELPMGPPPGVSVWSSHWSTKHWSPIVNGYSGVIPPPYYLLPERLAAFPSPETISLLQGIGVRTVVINRNRFSETEWQALSARIAARPELTLALAGDYSLYELAPDPWLWRLADAVPSDEPVSILNASADPVVFGYLMAILQRNGHEVDGNGQIHYLTLDPPSSPRCYAALHRDDNPAAFGYVGASVVRAEHDLALYRHPTCSAHGS